MGDPNEAWTEDTSDLYRENAPVAVPAREEIWATMLALIPCGLDDAFRALDLGCGHGTLEPYGPVRRWLPSAWNRRTGSRGWTGRVPPLIHVLPPHGGPAKEARDA